MKKQEEKAEISTNGRQLKKVKDDRPYDFNWSGLGWCILGGGIIVLALLSM